MRYQITLKAELGRGVFYWVTEVDCSSEEKAVAIAEHRFMEQVDSAEEWEFTDFEIKSPDPT